MTLMKLSKIKLAIGIVILLNLKAVAQDNSVGINVLSDQINQNAVLHLVSPNGNQGLLIPQLTTDQRNAMTPNLDATSTGLIVFDIDQKVFYFWNDTAWRSGLGLIGQTLVNGDLEGSFPTLTIKDGVITNEMITDAIIGSEKLVPTGITAGDFGGNVSQILQISVNAAGQIIGATTFEILVQETNIADNAVTSAKISDATIVEADIADDAITTAKIAPDAITATEVVDDSIEPENDLRGIPTLTGRGILTADNTIVNISGLDFYKPRWLATNASAVLTTDLTGQFVWEPRGNFSNVALLGGQIFVGGGGVGANEAVALTVSPGAIIVGDVGQVVQRTIGGAMVLDGSNGSMQIQAGVVGDGLGYAATTIGRINIGGSLTAARTIVNDGNNFSFDNSAGGNVILSNGAQSFIFRSSGNLDVDGSAITLDATDASNFTVANNNLVLSTTGSGNVNVTAVGDLNVTASNVNLGNDAIQTSEIQDVNVTAAKVNADVAGTGLGKNGGDGSLEVNLGNGLQFNGDDVEADLAGIAGDGLIDNAGVIDANVDNSTVEVNADVIRVVAEGITANEIATGAVTSDEILDETIVAGDVATGAITTDEILDATVALADIGTGAVASDEIVDNSIDAIDINTGAVTTDEILDATIATVDIADDAVDADKINADIAGAGLGQNLGDGSLEVNLGNGLQFNGDDIEADLAGIAGDGLVDNAGVIDANVDNSTIEVNLDVIRVVAEGITANEIATGAVTSDEILDETIVAGDVATGAITTDEILDATVALADIGTGAVASDEIVDNSIDAIDINTGAVTTDEILDATVALADIGTGAVASDEIVDNSIDAIDINTGAVTTDEILDATIATVDIADDAVDADKINADIAGAGLGQNLGDGSLEVNLGNGLQFNGDDIEADLAGIAGDGLVDNAGVIDANVDNSTIEVNLDVIRVVAEGITANEIATSAVTSDEILDETIVAGDVATGAITTDEILDATVALADIGTGAVASDEIVDNSIDAIDINTGAVTTDEILDATVALADIGTSAVASDEIVDNSIDAIDINTGAVTTDEILDATIATGDIADDAVNAAKINADIAGAGLGQNLGDGSLEVNLGNGLQFNGDDIEADLAGIAGDGLVDNLGVIDANVDNSTIEVNLDVIRVVAEGITANEIATGAVTSDEILDETIVAGDVATGAITTDEILDATVALADIGTGAVASDEIVDNSIDAIDINTGAVTTDEILDATVALADIGTGAVASDEIVDNSIDAIDINTGAVTTDEILDATIATGDIADDAVNAAKINADIAGAGLGQNLGDGSLEVNLGNGLQFNGDDIEADLAGIAGDGLVDNLGVIDANVDNSTIEVNLDVIRVVAEGITANEIATGAVTSDEILDETIVAGDVATGAITTDEILDATVALADIGTGAVASDEIVDNSIDAIDINTGAVTTDEILDATVALADIGTGAVASDEIVDNSIDAIDINTGAVTTDEILDATIATGDIADDAVNAAKINADIAGAGLGQNVGDGSLEVNLGNGLQFNGDDIEADLAGIAGDGLVDNAGVIDANVDNSTIEVNLDVIRVVAEGITANEIATSAVTTDEILDATVALADIGTGAVASDEIVDNSIDAIDINTGAVTTDEILDATVALADIGTGAVASDEIVDNSIDAIDINTGAVTTDEILDATIATGDIADDAVNATKINADIAGAGLGQNLGDGSLEVNLGNGLQFNGDDIETDLAGIAGAGLVDNLGVIDANVDNSTIEINTDVIRVVAEGITANEIATSAVTTDEILDATVALADIGTGAVASDEIVDNSIDAIDINTGAVTTDEILDATVALADIGTGAVASDEIVDNSIDAIDINTGAVTTDEILNSTIATADLADDAVTAAKINGDVAGTGLQQNGVDGSLEADFGSLASTLAGDALNDDLADGDLDVQVDGSTIEITTNALNVVAEGITANEIATSAVTTDEILDATVALADIGTGAVASDEIVDNSIDAIDINTGAVTTDEILDATIATGDIADDAVNATKINADIAGAGLGQNLGDGSLEVNLGNGLQFNGDDIETDLAGIAGAGLVDNLGVIDANVDNSTIEINTDVIRVVAEGITANEIATSAVTTDEILDATVALADIGTGAVASDEIVDNSIDAIDINTGAVTTDEILDATVALADIGTGAVASDEIVDNSIDAIDINTGAVTTDEILNSTIATADLADDAVTAAKINGDVAGTGLQQNGVDGSLEADFGSLASTLAGDALNDDLADGDLDVQVDGSTIEITTNALNVVAEGITANEIATSAVTTDEILDATVALADIGTGAVASDEIVDNSIDAIDINTGAVTTDEILDATIATGDIADDAVNATKINADIAGAGLGQNLGDGSLEVNLGNGLQFNGDDIETDLAGIAGAGLVDNLGVIDANVDNSTIEINTDVIRVVAEGITANEIATSAVTTDEILDATVGLADIGTGAVASDEIVNNSIDAIDINTGAVTTDEILDATVANVDLANSSVNFGGVSVALGASDLTPAFDLTDATNYPVSSLAGTLGVGSGGTGLSTIAADNLIYSSALDTYMATPITAFGRSLIDDANQATAQATLGLGTLATLSVVGSTEITDGAVANVDLANSSVNFGGVSVALGASDLTPAFDLTDATNYPVSSLAGTLGVGSGGTGLSTIAADNLIYSSALDTYMATPITAFGRSLIDDANQATAQATLGLGTLATLSVVGSTEITDGAVANVDLANSSVNFGGVSVALGASDLTPAFDLTDATNYPVSSLAGTLGVGSGGTGLSTIAADNLIYSSALDTYMATPITAFGRSLIDDANQATAQATLGLGTLATLSVVGSTEITDGAVANVDLANSSVNFGGVSVALGASDLTPAFDLTDATNYPVSSLAGTLGVGSGGTGLSTIAADNLIYSSALDTYMATPITAFGRSLIDDANQATAQATLGLGTLATLSVVGSTEITDGAVANVDLANSSVNFGGVSVALGASDLTPAFDLTDATNYPVSSLAGTLGVGSGGTGLSTIAADNLIYSSALDTYMATPITAFGRSLIDDANQATAQATLGLGTLATLSVVGSTEITDGAVANVDLANSSVNFGGVSVALGASDLTPAFDLTDATNYPAASLTGTLATGNGGTGVDGSTATNGQLLIGNGTGYSLANISGTTNQVNVTNGAGTITLSTPQDINSTATPTFAGLTLTNLGTPSGDVAGGGVLSISAAGVFSSSDRRLKENIEVLQSSLFKINQLSGYTYNYISDSEKTKKLGVIAQELETVFPELVNTDKKGFKMVNYQGLIPVLIQAIKEQQQLISELQSKLDDEKATRDDLKTALEKQQKLIEMQTTAMLSLQTENQGMKSDIEAIKIALGMNETNDAVESGDQR